MWGGVGAPGKDDFVAAAKNERLARERKKLQEEEEERRQNAVLKLQAQVSNHVEYEIKSTVNLPLVKAEFV